MDAKTMLYIGGIYHLCFGLFDFSWPFLFNWKKTLASTDYLNSALLKIVSKLMSLVFLWIGYVSLFHTDELLNSELGKAFLVFVSIFWIIRLAQQFIFFGLIDKAIQPSVDYQALRFPFVETAPQAMANGFIILFLIGIFSYLIPLVQLMRM